MKTLTLICLSLAVFACSDDPQPLHDAGPLLDAAPKKDQVVADQIPRADVDLGQNFGLQVPAGTRVCTTFSGDYQFSDAFHEYALRGRATLKPGVLILPRDQSSFAADLIE